jgi:hypothetical protein
MYSISKVNLDVIFQIRHTLFLAHLAKGTFAITSRPSSSVEHLSSFRFILKQQWTIEEISIFSNSSHLEWRAGLSDTILEEDHPMTILSKFGSN